MVVYEITDSDLDSTERYFYRYPSVCCIQFLSQHYKLLESMPESERKIAISEQYKYELIRFLRQEGGMGL